MAPPRLTKMTFKKNSIRQKYPHKFENRKKKKKRTKKGDQGCPSDPCPMLFNFSDHLGTLVSNEPPTQLGGILILTREELQINQQWQRKMRQSTMRKKMRRPKIAMGLMMIMSEDENENAHIDQETDQEDEGTNVEMKCKKKAALLGLRYKGEDAIHGNYLLGRLGKNLLVKESEEKKKKNKQTNNFSFSFIVF
jgi:hypothetical protein